MNWKEKMPIPSVEQERNINEIVSDRQKCLEDIVGFQIDLIPYSNRKGYNLETLFATLIEHVQGERGWIFAGLKNFSYKQFMPKQYVQDEQGSGILANLKNWKVNFG